ncbi:SusC/RagA family TonB-linked outer membrane protein [Mucilaginibacter sp.]|uniref:SusC/RagA family TonB-linked outer membrane protein n=1 Tax=Mucilaginibacter sp. TaxID=1882438 RepID=UPI0032643BFD
MKYFYVFAFLALSLTAAGQGLSGRVSTAPGGPLPGASVSLVGTSYGTLSGAGGKFTLAAPAGPYRLRVSYVGLRSRELAVTLPAKDSLLVVLEGAPNELSEVMVSTGYQQLPKERATGSFVLINRALLERSTSTDVLDRLRDVVPGLSFNSIGTRFSVRGQSTLFSNAEPLIVVDGFPYNQPIENLNPNDVESITVLKDAAAASIWGARAGNGVIVITTKKGRNNQPPQVTLTANVTVGERPDLFYVPTMSAVDYIGLEKRLFSEGYFDGAEQGDGHLPLSPAVELLIRQREGQLSAAGLNSGLAALSAHDKRNDLAGYFYRASVKQQYAASLSGGTDMQRYFVSGGYDRNLDQLAGNGYSRFTLTTSDTWALINKKLEFSLGLNYTESDTRRNNPGSLTWNRGDALYPYADLSGTVTKDHRTAFVEAAPAAGLLDWSYRPLDELRQADNRGKVADVRVSTGLKYKLPFGFSPQVLYRYERSNAVGRNLLGESSYFTRNLVNRYTQDDGSGTLSRAIPSGGILDLDNTVSVNRDIRGQLNYDRSFGTRHEVTAIAGYEVQSLRVLGDSYRLYGYDAGHATSKDVDLVTQYPYYDNPGASNAIPSNTAELDATDHYRSYYANAAYTYDGRITFSASGRIDQSNLFGVRTNQKGVPLYSLGAAWNIGREGFYGLDWLPELKLRASFGYNGNSNKSLSAFTTATYFDGSDSQTRLPYAVIANPPNPGLRWEKVRHINLGLDFGMKRFSGSIEYFFKKGGDLIGSTAFAPSTGISDFTGNTADTRGHGFDLSLESRNLTGGFGWTTNFIASYVTDRVTGYDKQSAASNYLISGSYGFYALEGRPLYGVYSYAAAGLDGQTGDPQGYLNGAVSRDYAAILAAATPQNLVFHGSSRPTLFGSLRNTFTYQALSLSANISYKLGYYYRRASVRYGNDHGLSQQSGDFALRWQQPGDEAHTVVPSMPAGVNFQRDEFYSYSSALVEKGDHIRLQDIRLGYRIKNGPELYLYAANIGILWRANRSHTDPEVSGSYTLPRTVAGGFRYNF